MGENMDNELLQEVLKYSWYHSFELCKGVVTPGRSTSRGHFPTMRAISRICLNGADCLDIGTMDGIVAFQMEQKGARSVFATCLSDRPSFRFARKYLGSKVQYFPGVDIAHISSVKASGIEFFDLVVCSGVLYHLLDPLSAIAIVRNLLKVSGIAVFETAISDGTDLAMHFNANGCFLPGFENMWMPTRNALHYMLSYCCFNPLFSEVELEGPTPRYAVVAQAVRAQAVETADFWLRLVHEIGGNYDPLQVDRYTDDPVSTCVQAPDELVSERANFPEFPCTPNRIDGFMRKSFEFLGKLKKAECLGLNPIVVYAPTKERGITGPVLARVFKISRNLKITGFLTLDEHEVGFQYGIPRVHLKDLNGMPVVCIDEHQDSLYAVGVRPAMML
jgi:2-polyprenyl-3-methyl-5-hydroxy-6-metoxy-1,4-benzoquinol methylase